MEILYLIIRIVISIGAGLLAGWGAPYVFKQIPAKWLCDYGEEPSKEMWENASKISLELGICLVYFWVLSFAYEHGACLSDRGLRHYGSYC